jgi:hypothetical protein
MAVENAISAGEISFALENAERFADEHAVAAAPLMVHAKPIVPLVLLGRFDDAIERGERTRETWDSAGLSAARWLAPSMYALVLVHLLRGDETRADELRRFAGVDLAGEQTRNVHFQVGGMATFVEMRAAMHFGRRPFAAPSFTDPPVGEDAWWQVRHWYFDAYPWAAAAELAAASGAADASARLLTAEPAASENRWSAAVVARARARLTGDADELTRALGLFEQLGARYERACTLALMPSRLEEARAELDELGVPLPANGG